MRISEDTFYKSKVGSRKSEGRTHFASARRLLFALNNLKTISLRLPTSDFRLLILFAVSLVTACGRVGDPLPPIRHRAIVPELLKVSQRGDELILSWPKPGVIALNESKVARAEILRRDEKADDPRRLPEEQFIGEARIIGSINVKDITGIEGRTLQYLDRLPAVGSSEGNLRYRYAIRYVQTSGGAFPLSNYAFLEPLSTIARAPAELKAELTQSSVRLDWKKPESNLDDTRPALVVGYNIYRRLKEQPFSDQPINNKPVVETSFEDRAFKFGSEYVYTVRSISQGKDSAIESPASEEISLTARDVFPPASPSNVTGAAAAGIVSLFWPANSEKDLKGYLVYRAEKRDEERGKWIKLTPAPITATTFRDERAESGKIYYYFITALDVRDNESAASEAAEVEVLQ